MLLKQVQKVTAFVNKISLDLFIKQQYMYCTMLYSCIKKDCLAFASDLYKYKIALLLYICNLMSNWKDPSDGLLPRRFGI